MSSSIYRALEAAEKAATVVDLAPPRQDTARAERSPPGLTRELIRRTPVETERTWEVAQAEVARRESLRGEEPDWEMARAAASASGSGTLGSMSTQSFGAEP